MRGHITRAAQLFLFAVMGYTLLAYLVLPAIWTHHEHQKRLADLPMVTLTAQGIPGDPINIGLVGDTRDVLCAMHAAGWYPADPVTLRSSIEIAGSVLLDRPYRDAPVSPLYYLGRREDLAFEKPVGSSADHRNHVRFWKVLDAGEEKRPVWLGDATFDRSVGVSHYTGAITHHIGADIDAERKLRRSLLHRRRGVDPAAGRGVPKADKSRRNHPQPGRDRDQGPDMAGDCRNLAEIEWCQSAIRHPEVRASSASLEG
jgi:hypothetical protein